MPVFAPRLIYSAATVQGWYLLHWLEVTPLADCGAIFAKVLDRLASGALRLLPAKRYRPQNIADALRDAEVSVTRRQLGDGYELQRQRSVRVEWRGWGQGVSLPASLHGGLLGG